MSDQKKVDEDWKRRAQMEKEQDVAKTAGAPEKPGKGGAPRRSRGGPAKADFLTLVETLASQALLFMGAVPDPMTGQRHQDLHQAQFAIDLIETLEEKTKGNLTSEEQETLRHVLDELRMTFVRLTTPPPPRGPMTGNAPRP